MNQRKQTNAVTPTHDDQLPSEQHRKAQQSQDYRGLILLALVSNPNGLTVRALESEVSELCTRLGWWLPSTGSRFDYDLQALRMEGLVEYRIDKRLALSAVGSVFANEISTLQ